MERYLEMAVWNRRFSDAGHTLSRGGLREVMGGYYTAMPI
jgi:hypothetical protein